MSVKLYVTKSGISHRGKTVNKGDVIEESDRNHIGALQSVGCQLYKEEVHGKIKSEAPKPVEITTPPREAEPEVKPEPQEPKKKRARRANTDR